MLDRALQTISYKPMMTFGDICCGGGGASLGLMLAGMQHRWGVEFEPKIAEVYRANIGEVICSPIQDVNPYHLEKVDILWCSFPCQAFSNARSKKLPPRNDADLGTKVLIEQKFLNVLQPKYVFIENVPQYAKSESFGKIVYHLYKLNYWVDFQVLNAADCGVPQTRRRLILRAGKNISVFPQPVKKKWLGWYDAIADLISTLPRTEFAPWQLKHLDKDAMQTSLVQRVGTRVQPRLRSACEPAWTIRALGHDRHWRQMDAFIAENGTNKLLQVTPRALARLQSFPDSYQLPASNPLAGHIVGNAVPPLLTKMLVETIV